jgi:hypothetical protein
MENAAAARGFATTAAIEQNWGRSAKISSRESMSCAR